ncbi:MAG TPA: GtrA family protein [Candidatus Paceibacterota bacterium]|nr:GtrA family protein [Candidatus Paceibacterota bacterium]
MALRILKFCISGGVAALTMLLGLYLLHGVVGIPYLLASVLGFLAAVAVNFSLQRWFVFERGSGAGVHTQAAQFLGVNLVALGVNTALLYILVEYAHLYYLVAQVIAQVVIAVGSFLAYSFVFRISQNPQDRE